jgi:HD superfamily phosphohydrolase
MIYTDRIYGKTEITERVILDLINCPSIQRLKGIDQAGYPKPWFPAKPRNRFDHSMGVFILLKKYRAPIEEQIAGLIHDISHLTFSHAIDYVVGQKEQGKRLDYQDNLFDSFVRKSEIPKILKKYQFDLDYILNEKNFPLKENKLPDICADRIDYFLRDTFSFGIIHKKTLKIFLGNLIEIDKKLWAFKDYKIAKSFAERFMQFDDKYYSGNSTALMFITVAEYMKYSLKKNYVSKKDFYLTDREVLNKISKYLKKDTDLKILFDRMNNKVKYKIYLKKPKDYEYNLYCKSRAVDPLCIHNNKLKRVSEIEPAFGKKLKEYLKPKEYFIKFDN